MENMKKNDGKDINLFCAEAIVEIGEMFKAEGYKLRSLFMKDSDLKFVKGDLDIHSSDITYIDSGTLEAFVTREEAEPKLTHHLWFEIKSDDKKFASTKDFNNWSLTQENKLY